MQVDRAGVLSQDGDGRGHVLGVERASHREGTEAGLRRRVRGERVELLESAGHDDLAGAVLVGGGESVPLSHGDDLVALAAEDGGHAGGGDRGGRSHRVAALTDEDHGLLGGDHTGSDGRGDLADTVARAGGNLRVGVGRVREQAQQRHQARADQERLRHGGVADRVGVALGAVPDEVDPGDGRQPAQAVLEAGHLQPGREEAGGLGALSGRDNDEHGSSVSKP